MPSSSRVSRTTLAAASIVLLVVSQAQGPVAEAKVQRERSPNEAKCAPRGPFSCPGVRPGAVFSSSLGMCTFNFVFHGSDGRDYIGSAGHCFLEDLDERTWAEETGPPVRDADGHLIGNAAYAINEGSDGGADFALVRLRGSIHPIARVCFFGGPTGINDDLTNDPVILKWFGNGQFIGYEPTTGMNTAPARWALASQGLPDPDFARATGPAIWGDSGSGVLSDDGRAVGVLVNLQTSYSFVGITRLGPQVERAERSMGIFMSLRTARRSN